MAYEKEGVKYSYDYSELLEDLLEDLKDGVLANDTIIHIVRGESKQLTESESYRPIIDYYTLNALQLLQEPLEETEIREDYSDKEWEEMITRRKKMIEQYKKDEPGFEKASVLAVVTEMETWNKVL